MSDATKKESNQEAKGELTKKPVASPPGGLQSSAPSPGPAPGSKKG